MKAIAVKSPSGPEVLERRDLLEPELAHASGILVRVEAAGVNPTVALGLTGEMAHHREVLKRCTALMDQ